YRIERSSDDVTFAQIASVGAETTGYTDAGLPPETTYYYRVRAVNSAGFSAYTVTAAVTTGAAASAVFVAEDAAAQGSWQGVYGAQGSALAGAATALPAWAQVAISGDYLYTWAATTTDPRGLQQPAPATGRAALAWITWGTTTFDVNLTDGLTHDVSLYAVDWESLGR